MVAVATRGVEEHVHTDLCEAEDVVNEEQHVLSFHVTEVLCDCQTCKQQGSKLSSIKVTSMKLRLLQSKTINTSLLDKVAAGLLLHQTGHTDTASQSFQGAELIWDRAPFALPHANVPVRATRARAPGGSFI